MRHYSYLAIAAFVAVYLLAAVFWSVPIWCAALYLAASLICHVFYAIDKANAVAGRWRISENMLLLLGLAGGWPGAIIAQQVLRHKTRKIAFLAPFWLSVVANITGFVFLARPG